MGDMAELYMQHDIEMYLDDMYKDHEISYKLKNRIKRYDVTDDAIREFLFNISVKSLCLLTDKVIMEYYPQEYVNDAELDKMIDISAFGLNKKYLTDKQKWCLASFCLFWIGEGKQVESEEVEWEEE